MNQETLHVPKRGRREVHTGDLAIGQLPPIDLSGNIGLEVRTNEVIAAVDTPLENDYFKELAFMEEPVTIRLDRSAEKNAAQDIPVAVNGKGCEVMHDGKWVEVKYVRVGVNLTVKRKYVETLARAKPMDIQTIHEDATVERPRNELIRNVRSSNPMTIVRDDNPRGHEWITRIMAEG